MVKKKKKDAPQGMVMKKAYRRAEPLEDVRRPRSTAATQALDRITSVFDPATMHERDESWMAQQVQLSQLSSFQQEIRELRARHDLLNDRLNAETRCADRAEQQLELQATIQDRRGRRHRQRHRSYSSDNSRSSPSHSRSPQSHSYHLRTRRLSPERQPRQYRKGRDHERRQRSRSLQWVMSTPVRASRSVAATPAAYHEPSTSQSIFIAHQPLSVTPSRHPVVQPPTPPATQHISAASAPASTYIQPPLAASSSTDHDTTFSGVIITPQKTEDGGFSLNVTPTHR